MGIFLSTLFGFGSIYEYSFWVWVNIGTLFLGLGLLGSIIFGFRQFRSTLCGLGYIWGYYLWVLVILGVLFLGLDLVGSIIFGFWSIWVCSSRVWVYL